MYWLVLLFWLAMTGGLSFLIAMGMSKPNESTSDTVLRWLSIWAMIHCLIAFAVIVLVVLGLVYALKEPPTDQTLADKPDELLDLDRQIAFFHGINQARDDEEITRIMQRRLEV